MIGLVGKKVGMTRIFTEDGVSIPVTVIEVEANRVTQVKDLANDGYRAIRVTTGAGDRHTVFDLQMVIWRTVDPIDHCRADPDELYVFDAHPSVGAGLFRRRHCLYLRANLPRHARLSGSGRALNAVVYRCWPLSNLADDVNRRAVVSQSCHYADASGA